MTVYVQPGQEGSKVQFKDRYENWIGGEWVAPTTGQYIENVSPVNGKQFTEVARGAAADVELALDAAHKAAPSWGKASATERAAVLNKIADRIDANLEMLAVAESWDTTTQIGAQASVGQMEKILSYIDIGLQEGARILAGGNQAQLDGDLAGGFYVQPTIFEGNNKMRIFQEEIFGPVVSVARFSDYNDAISIANDTLYGLGAGVWSRNGNVAYRAGREIQAGRVWVNNYHAYPAGAAFGGYKSSGIGRENHSMMLDHYQQTKNLLVSHSENKLGFF
jgi:aldehyde dehydrogenase